MTTPTITRAADVVLFGCRPRPAYTVHVLLIRRGHQPYAGRWALPGGRVDPGESSEQTARRELTEETGLPAPDRLDRVDLYDTPDRDPRGRVISMAYVGLVNDLPTPTAGDDANAARWVPLGRILNDPDALAFDHHTIVRDALARVQRSRWWLP